MATAETRSPVAPDSVNLVDKDNTRRVFLTLDKEVTYTRRAHTHEHLDKVRAADAEKRHPCFPSNGPRQQCLAGSRRPHQKATFGDPAAKFGKLFRVFQKSDDFLQIVLGFIHP